MPEKKEDPTKAVTRKIASTDSGTMNRVIDAAMSSRRKRLLARERKERVMSEE